MASWIGASDAQRFWQYILPAAKRAIADGDWDRAVADYERQIADATARMDAAMADSFDQRAWRRRVASLTRDRDSCIASRERDIATIAEADRRRARRRS